MSDQPTPPEAPSMLERINSRRPLSPGCEQQLLQFGRYALVALLVFFCVARFVNLTLDFPPGLTTDGDALTDEGLYAHNAINHYLTGDWYVENDFNQVVSLPVLQVIQTWCFQIFGFGLGTARSIVVVFSFLYIAGLYVLMRRWSGHWTAFAAAALLAGSHLHFAFSRVSVAEAPMAAFLVWAFVFGAWARGKYAYLFTGLAAVAFTAALLTKTNALFAVPLLGGIVIAQELEWRRILFKFLVATGVFLVLMGTYFFWLVRPNMDEFLYFYSINVGVTSSYHPADMWREFWGIVAQTPNMEFLGAYALPIFVIPLLFLSRTFRTNPLFYIAIAWYVLYLVLFSTYGRFHNRFFVAIVAPVSMLMAIVMKEVWDNRDRFWPAFYGFGIIFTLTFVVNFWHVGSYLTYTKNSFNEAAQEIRRIMDADPDSNNVLMGHTAASFALRNGVIPRHDRYGVTPLEERLRTFRPSYTVSEMAIRNFPLEPYYQHREILEAYARFEVVGEFDVLENYRHHPIVLYKVHPHDPPEEPEEPEELDEPDEDTEEEPAEEVEENEEE